jgi:serine/threonine-protein kinase
VAEPLPRTFGPYALLSSLGSGAAGEAFLARPHDPSRGVPTPIVIKCLHQKLADSEEFVKRFRHEAEIAVRVTSRHIAYVYDVGAVGDTLYFALDYVPGFTLSKLMVRLAKGAVRPPLPIVSAFVTQCLAGLDDLHNATDAGGRRLEIVHRDVSPKNIMVGDDGVVRLIDLGLGKSKAQDWQTRDGRVMGSPGYMAPEQIKGEVVDHRADVFAIGVVAYEMLTLRRYIEVTDPVSMLRAGLTTQPTPPSRHRLDVTPELDEVIGRAMSRDRETRFGSAGELAEALRRTIAPVDERALAAFVEKTLGPDATVRRTELDRLLSMTFDPPDEPEIERTVVLAKRSGVRSIQLPSTGDLPHGEDTAVAELAATKVRTSKNPFDLQPRTMPSQEASMQSIPPSLPARPSRLPTVLMVAGALLIGLIAGQVLQRRPDAEPFVVVEPAPPPPAPPPVMAQPSALPKDELPEVSAIDPPEEEPRAPRAAAKPRPPPRVAPPPPAVEPPPPAPSLDEEIEDIKERLERFKKSHSGPSIEEMNRQLAFVLATRRNPEQAYRELGKLRRLLATHQVP